MASSDSSRVVPNPSINDNANHTSGKNPMSTSSGNQHIVHVFESMSTDSMSAASIVGVSTASVTYDESSPSNAPTSIPANEGLQFVRSETKGTIMTSVYATPNGTSYWIPDVDDAYTPVLNSTFKHWEDVMMMYNTYAAKSGFSTRLSTTKRKKDKNDPSNKQLTHRYILCSKAGKPKFKNFNPSDPPKKKHRRSRFTVSECRARLTVRYDNDKNLYEIYGFNPIHNHCMVSSDNADLMKQNRQLGFEEQQFIHRVSLNKIGPHVAHNIQVSLKGGPHNVRGTKDDFKNCTRDIRLFIGERDAQLILDTMNARTRNLKEFYFDYVVVDNELRSFFWVDFVSLRNYESFGDVCAFDATYDTNKYNMIFVPFTGVDHHKKCVTFGAGMLYDETIESYTWLLNTFLTAHKHRQPTFILTDQDAAMKQAVSTIFTKSIHRLCMWHIMRKLPSKISKDILDNTTLRSSIHKLVWNLFITPDTFESRWHLLMEEYQLTNHPWLCEMFDIRHNWVPCYFREISMSCLMKTTSRCESSNARFKVNSKSTNTLVQFLMCFDTSIDDQRHTQRKMEFESDTSTPRLSTGLRIESHAAEIYTWSMFTEVRKEIYMGMMHCLPIERPTDGSSNIKHYTIRHCKTNMDYVNEFEVALNVSDNTVRCTCMGFIRLGYLCRHAFCAFRYNQIDRIPSRYIQPRWRRDALPAVVHSISNMYSSDTNEVAVLRNEISELVSQCMTRVRRNPENLRALSAEFKQIRNRIFKSFPDEPKCNQKTANISDILNLPATSDVNVHPPQGITNKGCGTKKQRIGPGQKVKDKRKKAARHCNKCNKYVYDHDSRNCEKVRAAKLAQQSEKRAAESAKGLYVPTDTDEDDDPDDNYDDDDASDNDVNEEYSGVAAHRNTTNVSERSSGVATHEHPLRRSSRPRNAPGRF